MIMDVHQYQQNPEALNQTSRQQKKKQLQLDLAALPQDLLILLASYIDPWDIIRFRRVSRAWNHAFSDTYLLQRILRQDFMHTLEIRRLVQDNRLEEFVSDPSSETSLQKLFKRLACRYYHLSTAKPRSVLQLELSDTKGLKPRLYPIGAWNFHQSRENVRSLCFEQAFWSYDDGLLVFSSKEHGRLAVIDLETETIAPIPFETEDKVIRNFRIKSSILVIEWAESDPFHALNETEAVHRHFVTLYKILSTSDSLSSGSLSVAFHSEFKLHFLGLPFNGSDRFVSTHTASHYAVYFWLPNRSMYTGDEEAPIESLLIFDISQPSNYHPSLDPSGSSQPSSWAKGPKSICRLSFHDLSFYNIRQHGIPSLMSLSIPEPGVLRVMSNYRSYTPGYFDPSARNFRSSCTNIPFLGFGPHHHIASSPIVLPPYVGNSSLESEEDLWDPDGGRTCYENWINVIDRASGVRYSLSRTTFTGMRDTDDLNWTAVRVGLGPIELEQPQHDRTMAEQPAKLIIGRTGKLAGDERWLIGEADGHVNILRFDR